MTNCIQNKMVSALICLCLCLLGCSDGSSSSTDKDQPQSTNNLKVGTIENYNGLEYITNTQSGIVTNNSFTYEPGETVEFYIGGIKVGEIAISEESVNITIEDILPDINDSTECYVNALRFFETIDDDFDATNGINIDSSVLDTASNLSDIDFCLDYSVFNSTVEAIIAQLTNGQQTLVTAADTYFPYGIPEGFGEIDCGEQFSSTFTSSKHVITRMLSPASNIITNITSSDSSIVKGLGVNLPAIDDSYYIRDRFFFIETSNTAGTATLTLTDSELNTYTVDVTVTEEPSEQNNHPDTGVLLYLIPQASNMFDVYMVFDCRINIPYTTFTEVAELRDNDSTFLIRYVPCYTCTDFMGGNDIIKFLDM